MEKCFYLEAVDAVRYERTRYTVVIKLKPQPRGRLAQIIKSEDSAPTQGDQGCCIVSKSN